MNEKEKSIAVVLSKSNDESLYIPKKAVIGYLNDTEFIDEDNNVYYPFGFEKEGYDIVTFITNYEILKDAYDIDDKEEFLQKFIDDVKNYVIIYKDEELNFIYKDDLTVLGIDDFQDHFINKFVIKSPDFSPTNLYNSLHERVYCQNEAIKRIVVALSLHYMDNEEKQKSNIIIDGASGTGKSEIIKVLSENMPTNVLVEDLSNENFSFDYLFLSLANEKNISPSSILVLDNADKLLLSTDTMLAKSTANTIRDLMLGADYKVQTNQGFIDYPTKDMVIIVVGDFSKRLMPGINNYAEGVPEKIASLTNYNIKMNPLSKDMVKMKLLHPENGIIAHYNNFFEEFGVDLYADERIVNDIVNEVMKCGMHELDKIVEHALEEIIFNVLMNKEDYSKAYVLRRTLKNNKKFILE